MREKIVAHLREGEVLKGYSRDFRPDQGEFHLLTLGEPVASSHRIEIDALKALFFVRTWGRPPGYTGRRYRFGVGGMREEPGRRAVVRFHDGEKVWGYVLDEAASDGFYLVPADPFDNNIKIYVNHSSIEEFRFLDEPTHGEH